MANLEKPYLRATEATTDQDGLEPRLEDPTRVVGRNGTPEHQRKRKRIQRTLGLLAGGALASGLVAGGVELLTNNARQSVAEATQNHETINDDPITDTTNEPLPSASPEFVPMNPYTYELNGEFENVSALDLDTLSKEFTPTSTSFGEPVIEGALQTLANYEPTEKELDEFEAMARAEFEGLSLDEPVDYRERGAAMLAQQVLVKRAEMVITGTTHIPTGDIDSLFKTYGENRGILADYIVDTQIKKYEAKLKGEEYKVDFEVLREVRDDPTRLQDPDSSYIGTLSYETYFSATDSEGKDLGAARISATTVPNFGGGETIPGKDGTPALVGTDGKIIYDKNGNEIPAIVVDDAVVEPFDSLADLKKAYTMIA